jgi:hypothetical protein
MCEEGWGRRCADNERGIRQGDETLMELQLLPAAVDWDAASVATRLWRDGSRGW